MESENAKGILIAEFSSVSTTTTIHNNHRRTGTVGLGGGGGCGDLIARKKLHNARKHVLHKSTTIALKLKTLPIRTYNERIIIPKLQLNPKFSNLRGKRKLYEK